MNTTLHIPMLTKHIHYLTTTRFASSHLKHFSHHTSLSNLNLVFHLLHQTYHPSLFIHYILHPPRSPLSTLGHYPLPTRPFTHHSYAITPQSLSFTYHLPSLTTSHPPLRPPFPTPPSPSFPPSLLPLSTHHYLDPACSETTSSFPMH